MLRGLGDLKDMGAMLKKVMDMKTEMESVKESLAKEFVEGQAGAGFVRVVVNGKMELVDIRIDRTLFDVNDPGILETNIKAAVNDAMAKMQDVVQQRMASITQGLNIPGLTG